LAALLPGRGLLFSNGLESDWALEPIWTVWRKVLLWPEVDPNILIIKLLSNHYIDHIRRGNLIKLNSAKYFVLRMPPSWM
jgi:hypothetical protein